MACCLLNWDCSAGPTKYRNASSSTHGIQGSRARRLAVTVQAADAGDTRTLQQTLAQASENIEVVTEVLQSEPNAPEAKVEGPAELVTDKGYHSREVVRQLAEAGIRSYISEPERG